MKDKEKQFKERIDCSIAYCEDTAIEEIKQDFKMHEEKNKQIEEMAKVISKTWLVDLEGNTFFVSEFLDKVDIESIATEFYEQGYRKLPENSVVLSSEEYEILTKDIEHPTDEVLKKLVVGKNLLTEQVIEKTRKETAEKFAKECKKYKVKKFSPIGIAQRDIGVSWIEMPEWKFDELAKQFSVEIKEMENEQRKSERD